MSLTFAPAKRILPETNKIKETFGSDNRYTRPGNNSGSNYPFQSPQL